MAHLPSIVAATRASAAAVKSMQKWARAEKDAPQDSLNQIKAREQRKRAERRFFNAQAVLGANPLPGDR